MRAAASSTSLHASPEAPILEARDLSVRFRGVEGTVVAVHRASIALYPGEVLGIVGESGSGKSTLAQALMGHRPPGSTIASGEVLFGGRSILDAPKSWLQGIWGSRVAMVHQNALSTLTPTMSVGDQISETIRAHKRISWAEAKSQAIDALASVNIVDPGLDLWPLSASAERRPKAAGEHRDCALPEPRGAYSGRADHGA